MSKKIIAFLGCGSWGGALGDVLSKKGYNVNFGIATQIHAMKWKFQGNTTYCQVLFLEKMLLFIQI